MEIEFSPLESLSFMQLVKEAIQMNEIIIKLVNSDKRDLSLFANSIIPFLAFVVDGIIKFFPDDFDYSDNDLRLGSDEFRRFVGKVRVGHKLYNDKRYNKKLEIIQEIQANNLDFLTSDYNIIERKVIEAIGQKDYATFSYRGNDYFNNMQGYIYLAYLSESINKLGYKEFSKNPNESIKNMSSSLTAYLNSAVMGFINAWGINIDNTSKINIDSCMLDTDDHFLIDSDRKDIFNDKLPSEVQILLHNFLCQMNFVSLILPEVLLSGVDLYVRFKIITYLESIKNLSVLAKRNDSIEDLVGREASEVLNTRVYKLLSKRNIRNNVAHYRIQGYSYEQFDDGRYPDNTILTIIEIESGTDFQIFWQEFQLEFEKLKKTIETLIF